ncbi:hypothetical protein GWI33_009356 [Rhynchophorus ferrugineus]|uniref:Uncharacterized protein n=1 Tax=Rhynchophorus ferrugineus TaxID=354439 RepID=A0A834ICE8_RHYFE|nr:hypothetical protein GWI33_009356 [Rhynchophorus ferrugineus]
MTQTSPLYRTFPPANDEKTAAPNKNKTFDSCKKSPISKFYDTVSTAPSDHHKGPRRRQVGGAGEAREPSGVRGDTVAPPASQLPLFLLHEWCDSGRRHFEILIVLKLRHVYRHDSLFCDAKRVSSIDVFGGESAFFHIGDCTN